MTYPTGQLFGSRKHVETGTSFKVGTKRLLNLEEHSEGSPHRINFSVCPSICPSVCLSQLSKHVDFSCRNFTCGVFCPSSIPSEYLFLCARREFGFNKKIRRNLLIVYVYCQPNSCNTHAEHEWAGGTFSKTAKKIPPAHAQWV
jgi:hypothetical protein